ncbi:MAG: hypothetical protein SP1CHLAM54_08730 [Chlamydiia bacterium]|nr:hypothetical protein [Chlamydiia bacterium]MCH9615779.1 hypothetical protein [Chlamydiia bacterium]MCH9628818.1 hypothetical protein [Chlamydiia bacterium]
MSEQLIKPSDIDSELQRIWESLQGTNKMRACLFNLIIYSKKDQRVEYLKTVAQKIIKKFPSRIIFATCDPRCTDTELKASVSVVTAEQGENEIVCDMIHIDACGTSLDRVPFVILPHILPDLPIYLLYGSDPITSDPISEQIETFATRIIFDSETSDNLPQFARAVLEHQEHAHADIADLNWARTEEWRTLLTDTFHTDERLAQLKNANSIRIHYNSSESKALSHTHVQSVYLGNWLATQLGWQLQGIEEKHTFIYDKCKIELIPKPTESITSGRVLAVEINTSNDEHFHLHRNLDCQDRVTIEVSTPEVCYLPLCTMFRVDEVGQSLVHEVTHRGTSQHYLNLMKTLSTLEAEI